MNEVVPIYRRLVCSRPTEPSSELSIDPSGIGLLTDALSLLNSEKGERDSCRVRGRVRDRRGDSRPQSEYRLVRFLSLSNDR